MYEYTAEFFDANGARVYPQYTVSGFQPALGSWIEVDWTFVPGPRKFGDTQPITLFRAVAVIGGETVHVEAAVIPLPSALVSLGTFGPWIDVRPIFFSSTGRAVRSTFTVSGRYPDGRWFDITTTSGEEQHVVVAVDVSAIRVRATIEGRTVQAEAEVPPKE